VFCFCKPEREETLAEHAEEDKADSQTVCSYRSGEQFWYDKIEMLLVRQFLLVVL